MTSAFSSVQTNGYIARPFPIQRSETQGCPMSMLLFALVLNTLICLLERHFWGVRIVYRTKKTTVVAYADNVTIFVRSPADIFVIGYLLTYEGATGVLLNIRKSKATSASLWNNSTKMLIIPCYQEITVVGFRFSSTVTRSGKGTWSWTTGKVKALSRDA